MDQVKKISENIKLVICDMDGTLLNDSKIVSKATIEVIKRIKNHGKMFSICTGRIPAMMQYYIDLLELETPFVSINGAILSDPRTGKIIYDLPMNEEEALELLSFLKLNQMDYCALASNECYYSSNSVRIQRYQHYNQIACKNGLREIPLTIFDDKHSCVKNKNIYKIIVNELLPGQLKKAEEFVKQLKITGCTSSEPNLLDISEIRVDKGYGLSNLLNYLNLSKNQVCAFGDYYNDIPMLILSGLPVAMENGCQEAKDNAVFVTKSNENDGVAWFLQQYL